MPLDLSVNLGQVLTAASFTVTVVWGVARMQSRTDEFFRTLERHEDQLEAHGQIIREHGERIAHIEPKRRFSD